MSKWTGIPKENIELDGDELNVCIGSDTEGNNYITLKVADVLAVADPPHSDTKDNREIEKVLLRALMTTPNNLQEKTINGKTINVFEIQNYHIITQLIQSHTSNLLDTLLEAMPEKKQMAFVKEMRSKGKMNDENRCRYYRYGGHDFAIDQITTIIKEMRK